MIMLEIAAVTNEAMLSVQSDKSMAMGTNSLNGRIVGVVVVDVSVLNSQEVVNEGSGNEIGGE